MPYSLGCDARCDSSDILAVEAQGNVDMLASSEIEQNKGTKFILCQTDANLRQYQK